MARLPFNKHVRLGDPQDNGLRPFSVLLAKLDVPMPATPGGANTGVQYVVTSEGAENWIGQFKDCPMRISDNGKSHFEADQLSDGTVRKRLAQVYGHVVSAEIVDLEDGKYLKVDGLYYGNEDPTVTDFVAAHIEKFGGSFEIKVPNEGIRQDGQIVYIDSAIPTGLAILERSSAAYQQLTRLLVAETVPQFERLAAEAQTHFLQLAAEDLESAEVFLQEQVATCDVANRDADMDLASSKSGVESTGGTVDAQLAATQTADLAESPDKGGVSRMAEDTVAVFVSRLEAQSAEIATLKSELAVAHESAKDVSTLLAGKGVETVAALIEKYDAEIETVKAEKSQVEADLASKTEAAEKLAAALDEKVAENQKVMAEAMFAEVKERYDETAHDRIKVICEKRVKGDAITDEEFDLWASVKAVETAPDGTETRDLKAEKVETPAPDQAAAVSKIFAEAREREAKGEFGTFRPKNAWIAEQFEALAKAVN
jgi:hypothetical protein